MDEVNPYQKPAEDEGAPRRKKEPFDPRASGLPVRTLRVMLGLLLLLGAALGVVVGSAVFAVVDRIKPVSWFIFDRSAIEALITVFLITGAALAWISWTLAKKGYPRRRLSIFGASGWMLGLLCVWGIVRSDTAAEERRAAAECAGFRSGAGPASTDSLAARCEADFLRCRRWLRQQPDYARLTDDAQTAMMSACMTGRAPATSP